MRKSNYFVLFFVCVHAIKIFDVYWYVPLHYCTTIVFICQHEINLSFLFLESLCVFCKWRNPNEIYEHDSFKKNGIFKDYHPDPIVQMGLLADNLQHKRSNHFFQYGNDILP